MCVYICLSIFGSLCACPSVNLSGLVYLFYYVCTCQFSLMVSLILTCAIAFDNFFCFTKQVKESNVHVFRVPVSACIHILACCIVCVLVTLDHFHRPSRPATPASHSPPVKQIFSK